MCDPIACCQSFGSSIYSFCTGIPSSCKKFWWTPESSFKEEINKSHLDRLRYYDLGNRVLFVMLTVSLVASVVLMAVGFKTPSPFHPLIGLYVCLGSIFAFPIALCILDSYRVEACNEMGIDPLKTHVEMNRSEDDDD